MDIAHEWSSDLSLDNYNDIKMVDGLNETNQRILRRLLTNPGEYLWHQDYGAGLGRYVGVALNTEVLQEITQLIISQMYLETSVAKTPIPTVTLVESIGQLECTIVYFNLAQDQLSTLNFTLQT
jgi:phage baseplate assembly protein W